MYLFVPLTTHIHNPFTASVGFFMWLAVRLGIIWEPIPNPAFPGIEPGTATMPSEHVGTELTGPPAFGPHIRVPTCLMSPGCCLLTDGGIIPVVRDMGLYEREVVAYSTITRLVKELWQNGKVNTHI